jgi:hypothetical protein
MMKLKKKFNGQSKKKNRYNFFSFLNKKVTISPYFQLGFSFVILHNQLKQNFLCKIKNPLEWFFLDREKLKEKTRN